MLGLIVQDTCIFKLFLTIGRTGLPLMMPVDLSISNPFGKFSQENSILLVIFIPLFVSTHFDKSCVCTISFPSYEVIDSMFAVMFSDLGTSLRIFILKKLDCPEKVFPSIWVKKL